MTTEEIIQQILSKRPELSRNQILENLKAEKNKTSGLITDETLLRFIAAKYGIKTIHPRAIYKLSISDLVAGLNNVTLTGRVLVVYPPRTFEGKKSGKVSNLLIADKDNTLRVVLWNDKVDAVESRELKTGQIIRFSHGYTRKNREGRLELHMGNKSQTEIVSQNTKDDEYPSIGKFATKINAITTANDEIYLAGKVKALFPASSFTRDDMSTGKVMRLTLEDETGEIPVVFWNEKAEELEKIVRLNANLQLVNAKIRVKESGELEAHVNSYTYFEVLESPDF